MVAAMMKILMQARVVFFLLLIISNTAKSGEFSSGRVGRVSMLGTIVDTPCYIHVGDEAQAINLSHMSTTLKNTATSSFIVKLNHCTFYSANDKYEAGSYFLISYDYIFEGIVQDANRKKNSVHVNVTDNMDESEDTDLLASFKTFYPGKDGFYIPMEITGDKKSLMNNIGSSIRLNFTYY